MATTGGGVDSGAPERPRCRCHDEPMDRSGPRWQCAVKRRARQLAAYHDDAPAKNYARVRRALRARIARKRERLNDLEGQLAQENEG